MLRSQGYRELTGCDQAARGPLLSPLLDHLQEILAVVVVADQMGAVENENQRQRTLASSGQSHLFQFVEGPLNVQQCRSVSRTADAKETANITICSGQ